MSIKKPKVVGYIAKRDLECVEYRLGPICMAEDSWPGSVALIRLSDYEALMVECEKLRKDAERYRWLREAAVLDGGSDYLFPEIHAWYYPLGPLPNKKYKDLDAAIDAAMLEGHK